jgi:hypothetical protein
MGIHVGDGRDADAGRLHDVDGVDADAWTDVAGRRGVAPRTETKKVWRTSLAVGRCRAEWKDSDHLAPAAPS